MECDILNVRTKSRRGFSLIELLIAIVVLGILTLIVVNGGASAQERARNTAVLTAFNDYRSAFSTSVLSKPGIMKDREEAWGDDGSSYTAKESMNRLLIEMNSRLEESLRFYWWPESDFDNDGNPDSSAPKVWRTQDGSDPWGGYYVLTEYPESTTGAHSNYFDPTSGEGESAMCIAIWATGKDEDIVIAQTVGKNSKGLCIVYKGGEVQYAYQGLDAEAGNDIDFLGSTITMK